MSLFEAVLGTAGKAAGDLFGPDNRFRRSGTAPSAHEQPAGVKAPPAAARASSDAVQGSAIATEKPRRKRKAQLQKQGGRSGSEDAAGSPDTRQAAPSKKRKATKAAAAEENGAAATVKKLGKRKKKHGSEAAAGSPDTSQAATSSQQKLTKAEAAEENGATATLKKLGKRKKKDGSEAAAGSPDTSQAATSNQQKTTKAEAAEENGATATVQKPGKRKKKQRPAASELIATPAAALQGKPPAPQEAAPAKKRKTSGGTAEDTPLVDKAEPEEGDDTTELGLQQVHMKTPEEEAEQLARTIFVGNLPVNIKKKQLKMTFSEYGIVESIRMRSVPIKLDKMIPRRAAILGKRVSEDRGTSNAYLVFKQAASVDAALAHNMKEVGGLHVRVDRAGQSRKNGASAGVEYDRARSIFIGNLAFDVEDEDVIRLFSDGASEADAVAAVRVIRDAETNLGKGFGFVLFNSRNGARMALARDGSVLKKRPIRVTKVAVAGRGGAAKSARGKPVSTLGRLKVGVAAGKGSKKPSASFGAVQRQQSSAPVASWQGMRTKGAGRAVKPGAAAAPRAARPAADRAAAGTKKQASGQKEAVEGRKRAGKRPAVAARKAKSLGLPAPKVLTAKQRERKKRNGKRERG